MRKKHWLYALSTGHVLAMLDILYTYKEQVPEI